MKTPFDLIVSLGGNCAAAAQLRMRGLRPFALPFDWLYMDDPRTIRWLGEAFENRFSDFFKMENLVEITEAVSPGGIAKYRYRDQGSGYCFIHHFDKRPDEDGEYGRLRSILFKRIDRLYEQIERAKKIMFILSTGFQYDREIAGGLIARLRNVFSSKDLWFRNLQFNCRFNSAREVGREYNDGNIFTGLYSRSVNLYDFKHTSCEWLFLDEMKLTGEDAKQIKGLYKLRYKLWKKLSKDFLNGGFALCGADFR